MQQQDLDYMDISSYINGGGNSTDDLMYYYMHYVGKNASTIKWCEELSNGIFQLELFGELEEGENPVYRNDQMIVRVTHVISGKHVEYLEQLIDNYPDFFRVNPILLSMISFDTELSKIFYDYLIERISNPIFHKYVVQTAIIRNNIWLIEKLIDDGIDMNSDINSYLKYAINNLITVQYLINNGADIHTDNDFCIKAAAFTFNKDLLKFLLDQDCDPNMENGYLMKTIINSNCRVNKTVHEQRNMFECLKLLMDYGANVSYLTKIELFNSIHMIWDPKLVILLIENGTDYSVLNQMETDDNSSTFQIMDILEEQNVSPKTFAKLFLESKPMNFNLDLLKKN